MNPNINLHIDSIVLDGIDLGPGQGQLLREAVVNQLTEMLACKSGHSLLDGQYPRTNSIRLGQTVDGKSLCPQVATAVYASVSQSCRDTIGEVGGQS